jgi:signal peptidase I
MMALYAIYPIVSLHCTYDNLYSMQMRSYGDRETTLELALECLARSGYLRLRVTGASMLPTIRPGSHVLIRRAPAEISPGDVILARTEDGVRLHRLVEIRGDGTNAVWITCGDNHTHCDPPLTSGQILGVLNQIEEPPRVSWFQRIARFA